MPRYVDYGAACLAVAVLVAAIVLPAPWAYGLLAAWTFGVSSYLIARARTNGRATAEMSMLAAGTPMSGGSGASIVVAHLEVQCSRIQLSRFGGPDTGEDSTSTDRPSDRFDAESLRSVMGADFVGHQSVIAWNVCSFPMRQYPGQPAEHAYMELLGPLHIDGRLWHLLELHIDTAELAADSGTASEAAATVRERVRGLLAHRGFATRTIPVALHTDVARMWHEAPCKQRVVLSSQRGSRPDVGSTRVIADSTTTLASALDSMTSYAPPAQGAGPIIGADDNDAAVCIDMCGPHIRTATLAGRFEALEFLILRMAALGRRAVAVTDNPDRWHGLAVAAGVDVIYSQFSIDDAHSSGRSSSISEAMGPWCDIVYWDSELDVPRSLSGHIDGPTVCRVLTGESRDVELRFTQRKIRGADLVVDGRISGWFTIHTRGEISDSRPRRVTVQAVETAAEIGCLEQGRTAPKPFATLTV